MRQLVRYILSGIAGAFIAMFAEPFFSAVLARVGIDTSQWAGPVVNGIAWLAEQEWFRLFGAGTIGMAIGTWVDVLLRKREVAAVRRKPAGAPSVEPTAVPGPYAEIGRRDGIIQSLEQKLIVLEDRDRSHTKWREAFARKKMLEQVLKDLERAVAIHEQGFSRYLKAMEVSVWPETDSSVTMARLRPLDAVLDARDTIKMTLEDTGFTTPDFEATPLLNSNPYSVKPPHLDRIPDDAEKYEYRKQYERGTRFAQLSQKLIEQIKADLSAQEALIHSVPP